MPEDIPPPGFTPTNYQRTTGGAHLRWQPPTPEHLQEMLPAYEILGLLGRGGMGAVYKGRQKSLDRTVAIKILPPEAGDEDMQFVERFKNEARTMAKMNHPAIVHVYDFGETSEGQLYIVMEFIDGTDVAQMILSQSRLPEAHALSITAHVCDALQYAHTHGVIHRDIKPANVLINQEGQVKVADFGLAKATDASQMGLTKTNMAMGTPDFVSPEALMPGVTLDGRADLYAVGVMLYQMLTGNVPRGAFQMPGIIQQTDRRFDAIIGKAMQMDREHRYQTALDLRRDLDVILTTPAAKVGGQTLPAQPPRPQKPMGKSPGAPGPKPVTKPSPPAKQQAATPAAGKTAPVPAPKSKAVMIYGIAAAVVVGAGAFFMFSGSEKKPAAAPKTVAEARPIPRESETKSTAPKPKPSSRPAESKPEAKPEPKPKSSSSSPSSPTRTPPPPATSGAPATVVAADGLPWVDGLAQWFGGTKTNDGFNRKPGEAVRVARYAIMMPLPGSSPLMRDMAVRARVRLGDGRETTEAILFVRSAVNSAGKASSYNIKVEVEMRRVRLGHTRPGAYQTFADYQLPTEFDFTTPHIYELRVVGDLLTVTLDGSKLGEHQDTQLTAGYPVLAGSKAWIESFEYANLDKDDVAPATAATSAPSPAKPAPIPAPIPAPLPVPAPAAPADPRLTRLEAGFQARYEADAQKPFLTATAALSQSYVTNGLARARAAAQAKGSLAEVTALDAEKAAVETGRGVPSESAADTPESLKALRGTYRTAFSKLTAERDAKAAPLLDLYLKALDDYVAELTKAGKIEEAKQVQAVRDAKTAPQPSAETAMTAPGPTATADDPATSKMSEREVAEWMLSTGAEISVEGISGIKDVASLPTGRITITTGGINCDKSTNADLARLSICREMTTLSFNRQFPDQGVINLESIRKLTQLKTLKCDPPRDDVGMEIITGLKNLTSLRLGKTEGKEMEKITVVKGLKSLRFEAVSSPNFAALEPCKNLRVLHVHSRPASIRDADVAALVAALPELEELTLGQNNTPEPFTDAALDELAKLKKLKSLYLVEAKVSDAALEKLKKALPDCQVTK